jgi:hypothetical protein
MSDTEHLTQEIIFDFMSDMSQDMRDHNIPIVDCIIYEFPSIPTKDEVKKEKAVDISEKDDQHFSLSP